ncbi:MAG: DUF2333 family protein [Bauldia sp.]
MLDRINAVLAQFGAAIRHAIRRIAAWIVFPFVWLWRFFWRQRPLVKIIVAVILAPWIIGYLHFIWHAAFIRGYDVDYVEALDIDERQRAPGVQITAATATTARACAPSYIAEVSADLIEFNVERNLWMSSNPFYKMGFFFLIDWDRTKFFDNKASFQRGVHQALQRTLAELTDTLGRVRGTAEADPDLSVARGNLQFDQYTWVFNPFSPRPFGPTTRSSVFYAGAEDALRNFQARLTRCEASFDTRADNLLLFLDRVAADIGSTSALLLERADSHDSGWFDTRADDYFMYAKGQMYAYYGILAAVRADFREVIESREIATIWDAMMEQIRRVIDLSPPIISNGREDGLIMPSHLTAIGFYILRARSNLVEIRNVLDR